MIFLRNDYCEAAHPEILKFMLEHATECNGVYGKDDHSLNAKNLIKKRLGRDDVDIYFIVGGTGSNKTVITHVLRPYEAVVSCDTGHINVHETGTIEASGHKVITAPNVDGKLTLAGLKDLCEAHSGVHMVKPKLVYISNATEYGTIYTLEELKGLSEYIHSRNMFLYVDGARLGSALTAESNDIDFADYAKYADIFYIGGTKNGAILGEAVVIVNDALKEDFRYTQKREGTLYAKGFIAGMQFERLFSDNLFFDLAKNANEKAKRLADGLAALGVKFAYKTVTNQIFTVFDNETILRLKQYFKFDLQGKYDEDRQIIRFVTSWATTDEKVDEALATFKKVL